MEEKGHNLYIGIDVQINRGCPFYIINAELAYIRSGWLTGSSQETCRQLAELINQCQTQTSTQIAVGIDAPRMGLSAPRQFYWQGGKWYRKANTEKGFGRHCEVVIKALGIANPQWTRHKDSSPPWMELGYRLFETLQGIAHVYEVFPSASYAMLQSAHHRPVELSFSGFTHGPKDMLDACMCAYTVHAFLHGFGFEVGGGDGLGTIILPGTLTDENSGPVLQWPEI